MPRPASFPAMALLALATASLFACAMSPARPAALVVGDEAMIEGEVVAVDTTPWAYDGNAVVTVSTANAGIVKVQLPARWNRCKAAPPADVQALRPGDRVSAAGTASATDTLVACLRTDHHLRRVE